MNGVRNVKNLFDKFEWVFLISRNGGKLFKYNKILIIKEL